MTHRNNISLAVPVLAANTNNRPVASREASGLSARLEPVLEGRARYFVVVLDNGAGTPKFVSKARFPKTLDAVRHLLAVRHALSAGADPASSDKWAPAPRRVTGLEYHIESLANAEEVAR